MGGARLLTSPDPAGYGLQGEDEFSEENDMENNLIDLLDLIDSISRDDDGDAMLDAEGLDELLQLAAKVREQHYGKQPVS